MQTSNLSTISDIVGALQNILARSQVIMPDLETPYSRPSFATTTNHFAIELKDHSISDIINERQQQLDAALDEISDLQTVIDSIGTLRQKLVQKTDKITQSINLHKRLVSALWRIPTEVLSQIFIHCLPDASRLPTLKQVPMLLTRICRRWREVAVDMPALWCRVSMGANWQRVASSYALWLNLSQGRPLSLSLRCDKHHWSELRRFLQPHINQVLSLFLNFSSVDSHPEVMIVDFPALEELSISVKGGTVPAVVRSIISQPPFTLRSLKLTRMSFGLQDLPTFNSAWARLTNVEITVHELQAFPRLLQLYPDLSSLTITTVFTGMEEFEPFMHAKLQSLRIFCYSLASSLFDYSSLFNALLLPNLRVFETRYIKPWPHDEFKGFLARSNCPLEELIFGVGMETTDKQRAEYIALIPSLEVVVDPVHIR